MNPLVSAEGASYITREEVRERVDAELEEWRSRIEPGYPRAFFSPDAWDALLYRYEDAEGYERVLWDAVVRYGEEYPVRQPVREYRFPEEFVSEQNALPSAQAELWLRPIGNNLINASLALAITDDPALRDHIREVVLTACAYPNWGLRSRGIHLSSAHLARGIAIAYDWHPDIWSEEEKEMIRETIRDHVNFIAEGLYGRAFWALEYDSNHNHVSLAGLGLCGLVFLDEIDEAAEWLAAALINFERVIPANRPDGSLPEGLSYWEYGMRAVMEFIEGTRYVTGIDRLYDEAFLRNAISYRLHSSVRGYEASLPWGATDGGTRAGQVMYALARQYQDGAGQHLADQSSIFVGQGNRERVADDIALRVLWYDPTLSGEESEVLDHHMDVLDIVTTRSGWSQDDYVLSIKSGINNRNHGHLDAGAIAFAHGGEWLLMAPGYGHGKRDGMDYWQRHGKGQRWDYFSTTTEAHSTLLINGSNQRWDDEARGTIDCFEVDGDWIWTGVDLSDAYSGVEAVRREVLHRRGDYILVFDRVVLSEPGTVEWLAQVPPTAEHEGGEIFVEAKAGGGMQVQALWPEGEVFARREPTVPHYDVAPNLMRTFRLMQDEQQEVSYLVAIVPVRPERETCLTFEEVSAGEEGVELRVKGEDWEDTIIIKNRGVSAVRLLDDASEDRFEVSG